jgi:hypothetical protein
MSLIMQESDSPEAKFVQQVLDTDRILKEAKDLSPNNPLINKCLSAFVGAVLDCSQSSFAEAVLLNPQIQKIRPGLLEKLSEAEFLMELDVGKMFAELGPFTPCALNIFRYRDYYEKLIGEEISAMEEMGFFPGPDKTIAFVGSGPLPMTAIDMHLQTKAHIKCVDSDAEAVSISKQMIENMGLLDKIEVLHQSGDQFDYSSCDMVIVAALVHLKTNVVAQIRTTNPDAEIGVRSAKGLKTLLYPPEKPDSVISQGYVFESESKDGPGRINTILLFTPWHKIAQNAGKPVPQTAQNRVEIVPFALAV